MTTNPPKYKGKWLRRKFKELRELYGNVCWVCGGTKKLQFAHIIETPITPNGRGRGREQRYYDIKTHPDSYALLDKRCHELIDNNPYTIAKPYLDLIHAQLHNFQQRLAAK